MKNLLTIAFLTLYTIASVQCSEAKVAICNISEIEVIIHETLLLKPENAEVKKLMNERNDKLNALNNKMNDVPSDKEARQKISAEMNKIHMEERLAEQKMEKQVKAEVVRICKEFSKGKYLMVLNTNSVQDAIVTKNADLIDITIDVKEFLQSNDKSAN